MVAASAMAPPDPGNVPQPAFVRWPLYQRILFRLSFCYFVLYAMPSSGRVSILYTIPGGSSIAGYYIKMWRALAPWVAIHIFHLSGRVTTYFPTGSGDTTLGYIELFCFAVLAIAGALIWSAADRKRFEYRRLHYWLRVLVRYTLAFTMFSYGFAKVFPLQFQPTNFTALLEPYGNFSPMGVLWRFMGASLGYTMFAGAAEVTGGAFLLLRRTTTLGAMICVSVLSNVVALNFSYDVPVKLYSSNLLLMALFLLAPDARRLANFLVLNRPAEPSDWYAPTFRRRWMRIVAVTLPSLFAAYYLYGQISGSWRFYRQTYTHAERPPLYGLYDVMSVTRNGEPRPLLMGDAQSWRRVIFERPKQVTVQHTNDGFESFSETIDPLKNTLQLSRRGVEAFNLTYSQQDLDHVLLEGKQGTESVSIRLQRIDSSSFLLKSRGFHWINELPFNR